MTFYNLNSDIAEGYGAWKMGDDDGLLNLIHSANIACGYHAGDHNIMAEVMKTAHERGVSIGAHPGFYDLHGFGRRQMSLTMTEIENIMAYQLGAAQGIASLTATQITHVKPHGALNNMACQDSDMAKAIARATKAVMPNCIFLAPALSELATAAESAGLTVAIEVFADRAYAPDGQLLSRHHEGAVLHDPAQALEHCKRMIGDGEILAVDGTRLKISAQSICVHGDEPSALAMASHVKSGLEAEGFIGKTLPEIFS